ILSLLTKKAILFNSSSSLSVFILHACLEVSLLPPNKSSIKLNSGLLNMAFITACVVLRFHLKHPLSYLFSKSGNPMIIAYLRKQNYR
uniref:Uncharacterized protein n=1 Tax=Chrysemys picta bellii TaxID=8478 RepID=A0A8C3FP27_CHRPI